MGNFIDVDVLTLTGVFFGATQSAWRIPDFASDNYFVKYSISLQIAVVIALFCTIADAIDRNVDTNVEWISNFLHIEFNPIIYTLVITLLMINFVQPIFQSILVRQHQNNIWLIPTTIVMSMIELSILTHILWII